MKNKKNELDVDFIGGQKPMTIEEELEISKFLRAHKEKKKQINQRNTKLKPFSKDKQPA